MKKIISFLMSVCILASFLCVPVTAAEISNENLLRAISVLQALDMVNDDYDELTISGDENVTRAEFANVAAGIFTKGLKSDKLYFHDVPREHWVFENVSVLLEKDIIKLNDEKRFYPDAYIRKVDAVRIVLRALGYGHIIDAEKSTDADVLAMGERLEILDGVSGNSNLKLSDMFILLYNAVLCETMEFSSMSAAGAVYENSGETFLEQNYSTYFEEGVLEGFDGAAVNSTEIPDDKALISGVVYNAEGFDLNSYLGSEVLYLFKYDKTYDERTLLWIEALGDEQDRITLDYYDNSVEFDGNTYTLSYYEGNRKKSVNLETSLSVIYNGEFVQSGIENLLKSPFYSMTLVRKENASSYDTVIISAYENFVVSGVDSINEIVYDKVSGKNISLKNIDDLEILKSDQSAGEFSDIKNGDVLSIFKSASGKRIKAVISNTVKDGIITSTENNDGYDFITVDGIVFRTLNKNAGFDASAGDMIALYIDGFGYIADFEYLSAISSPAYLLKANFSEDDESLALKLVDKSGDVQILPCTDKLKIDGALYKSMSEAYTYLGGKNAQPQIIVFEKNADNVVTDIDTLTKGNESDASLHIVNDFQNNLFKHWGMLGNKMNLDSNTVIFGIPDDLSSADDEDFVVKKMSNMSNDTFYISASYSTKEDVEYEDIVVIQGYNWDAPVASKAGILVTGINKGVNDDDEVVEVLSGYQGSAEIQVTCSEDFSLTAKNVKKGDFLIVSQNSDGEIINATIKYSPSGTVARPSDALTHSSSFVTTGYVNKVVGNMVNIGHKSGTDYDCRFDFSKGAVLVYDVEENEVYEGSVNDLISHTVSGENGSLVLGQFNWLSPIVYVVYKDDVSKIDNTLDEDSVFNLVTTFYGDEGTTRGFAWSAITDYTDMAIRYAQADEDWDSKSVTEAAIYTEYDGRLYYKADIANLEPGETYVYKIGDTQDDLWSNFYTFTTEPDNLTEFSFIGVTDPQSSFWGGGFEYYKKTLDAAIADDSDVDFIVNLGDMVETGYDQTEWDNYFRAVKGIAESIPHMAVVGNHETRGDAVTSGKHYSLQFNNPQNGKGALGDLTASDVSNECSKGIIDNIDGSIYSFDYGNAHFAVLNSGTDWSESDTIKILNEQANWLREDLNASDKKWKIVMIHQSMYPAKTERYDTREALLDVVDECGVDIVLQGHDHMVTRTYPMYGDEIVTKENPDSVTKGTGTVYTILGAAGPKRYADVTEIPDYMAVLKSTHSTQPTYSLFDVNNERISVITKQIDGTVVDKFNIVDASVN